MASDQAESRPPVIDTDKLSCQIFSILESKFLFGYDDQEELWIPKSESVAVTRTPPPAENGITSIRNQRGKICILSIDGGGGMRGILPGKALAHLELALKKKSGNQEARIADYFDVAAGTGTGGIFTAMLFASKDHSRPIFEAEDTWKFLVENGKQFYRGSSTESASGGLFWRLFRRGSVGAVTANMERALKEAFTGAGRRSLTLKDTLKPMLVPCFDLTSSAPFLFSRADALETESFDFRLWEVCRATAAEPGHFEPVQMQSMNGKTRCVAVDGGVAMSNPTAAAITHVLHNKQEFPFVRGVEDILVLSLGTGQLLETNNCDYDEVRRWKSKDWARPVARISSESAADMVDQAVAMAFGQSRATNYVRVQANGSILGKYGSNMDTDPNPNNMKSVAIAEEMLKQRSVESVLFGGKRIGEKSNMEKLDWFAGELVQEHQRRSCRIAPTVALRQPFT